MDEVNNLGLWMRQTSQGCGWNEQLKGCECEEHLKVADESETPDNKGIVR